VDSATRKDLKGDKFAEEVFDIFDWASEHKAEVIRYGVIAVAVVVLAVGVVLYRRSQADARQEALTQALQIDDGAVGPGAPPAIMHYDTPAEKDAARTKAYTNLATKYSGTQEGAFGSFALASDAIDKGSMAEAEKRFKEVADSGPKEYASLARIALSRVLLAEGKTADAQKLLQELANNPTLTVSKEAATLNLAQVMAKADPAGALKLLDPLRTSPRQPVSRVAVTEYGNIDQANPGLSKKK
jgi:predicted negative regulator of RcsB-dependent stress response